MAGVPGIENSSNGEAGVAEVVEEKSVAQLIQHLQNMKSDPVPPSETKGAKTGFYLGRAETIDYVIEYLKQLKN